MIGFALARRAQRQMQAIYEYGDRRWGEAQADRYATMLFAAFERIAAETIHSRPFPPAYGVNGWFCACQEHFIYWRRQRSGRIEIVAVVHQRMLQSVQVRMAFGLPV